MFATAVVADQKRDVYSEYTAGIFVPDERDASQLVATASMDEKRLT